MNPSDIELNDLLLWPAGTTNSANFNPMPCIYIGSCLAKSKLYEPVRYMVSLDSKLDVALIISKLACAKYVEFGKNLKKLLSYETPLLATT